MPPRTIVSGRLASQHRPSKSSLEWRTKSPGHSRAPGSPSRPTPCTQDSGMPSAVKTRVSSKKQKRALRNRGVTRPGASRPRHAFGSPCDRARRGNEGLDTQSTTSKPGQKHRQKGSERMELPASSRVNPPPPPPPTPSRYSPGTSRANRGCRRRPNSCRRANHITLFSDRLPRRPLVPRPPPHPPTNHRRPPASTLHPPPHPR